MMRHGGRGDASPATHGLRRGAALMVMFGDAAPSLHLLVEHTLFVDGNLHGDSNHALHLANRVIVQAILASIGRVVGPLIEVAGLPGVSPGGFKATCDDVDH